MQPGAKLQETLSSPTVRWGVPAFVEKSEMATRWVAIKKFDAAKKLIYGEVYAPYVLDSQGEFMTADTVTEICHKFMQLDFTQGVIDTQHDYAPNGCYPVECFVARKSDPDYTEGAWVLGVQCTPDIWEKVEKGEINGFSFAGLIQTVDVDVIYTYTRDNVGHTEKAVDHQHLYFVMLGSDGCVTSGMTDTVDGHTHGIRCGSVTEQTDGHAHRFFI